MKKTNVILLSCMLAFSVAARAGIVIDDAPPDATPKPQATPGTAAAKPSPAADILFFANRDVLHGTFLGCDKAGLHWQSPEAKEPILFQTAHLSDAKFDARKPPAGIVPATHSVMLTNGDELPGTLVSLDDKALVLDTWYAGKLTIPRNLVTGIVSVKGGAVLYEGPTGMDGWVNAQNNQKSWSYADGALIAGISSKIGRDMKLPDMARIEFDVAAPDRFQLNVILYSEAVDNNTAYIVIFNAGTVMVENYSVGAEIPLGPAMQLNGKQVPGQGQVQFQAVGQGQFQIAGRIGTAGFRRVPQNGQAKNFHIDIRVNKEKKSFLIYVNGTRVIQQTDSREFAGKGRFFELYAPSSFAMRISHIKVSAWGGMVEDTLDSATAAKKDVFALANGDHISGNLKEIAGGKAVLSGFGEGGDLAIPLDRIVQIAMASAGAEKIKSNPADVRAYFTDQGRVTMELESWDEKQITATSPDFGKAIFSPDAFQHLQFNPGVEASHPDENDPTGDDEPAVPVLKD